MQSLPLPPPRLQCRRRRRGGAAGRKPCRHSARPVRPQLFRWRDRRRCPSVRPSVRPSAAARESNAKSRSIALRRGRSPDDDSDSDDTAAEAERIDERNYSSSLSARITRRGSSPARRTSKYAFEPKVRPISRSVPRIAPSPQTRAMAASSLGVSRSRAAGR